MRFFLMIVLLVAAAAGSAFFIGRGYEPMATIALGEREGMVRAAAGGAEAPAICPLGIDAAEGENVILADLEGSKILHVNLEANTVREHRLEIAPTVLVEGVLFDAGTLFVWGMDAARGVSRIDALTLNSEGAYAVNDGGGFFDVAPSISLDARGRMEALGYVPEDDSGFLGSVNRLRSTTRVVTEQWQDSIDQADGTINVEFLRSGNEDVEFRVHTLDGRVISGVYVFEGEFVSARAYQRAIPGHAAIIMSESRLVGGTLAFAQSVILVDLATGEAELFRVPALANEICQPKQNLAITDGGSVYAISVQPDVVRINRLTPSGPFIAARFVMARAFENLTAPAPPPTETPAETPGPADPAAPEPAPAPAPLPEFVEAPQSQTIPRRAVVQNACLYLNHAWTMTEANYALTGRTEPWRRPRRLNDQIGASLTGLPYAWGGADRLTEFTRKLSLGRPAGDVCTPTCGGNVVRDAQGEVNGVYTAGVDCSGFVIRAWGWRGARHTTSSIANVSTPITLEELRPGDILNDAGSHVRMFVAWHGPSRIEIIESAVSCGGLCRRVLPLESFRGYAPLRPQHVVADDTITTQDIDAMCDPSRSAPQQDAP